MSFKCCMASGAICSANWCGAASVCGSTCHTGMPGIRTSCGGWPSGRPTPYFWRRICCGDDPWANPLTYVRGSLNPLAATVWFEKESNEGNEVLALSGRETGSRRRSHVHFAGRAGALLSGAASAAGALRSGAAVVHSRHAVYVSDARRVADRRGLVLCHHLGPAPALPGVSAEAHHAGRERLVGEYGRFRPSPNAMDLPVRPRHAEH